MANIRIPFNKPPFTGREFEDTARRRKRQDLRRRSVQSEMPRLARTARARQKALTTSQLHARARNGGVLADIRPGDEVIMPSFTFVSRRTRSPCGKDRIRGHPPDTMNLDENRIEEAITPRTGHRPRALRGRGCEMDAINAIAKKHNLFVIEDAAQGMMATHKGQGARDARRLRLLQLPRDKNYSMGEGGGLLIRDKKYSDTAEIIREKGRTAASSTAAKWTNTPVRLGSSYPAEPANAAHLYACAAGSRGQDSREPHGELERLPRAPAAAREIRRCGTPAHSRAPGRHNAHLFAQSARQRDAHKAPRAPRAKGSSPCSTTCRCTRPRESSSSGGLTEKTATPPGKCRLLRLPMFYNLAPQDLETVASKVLACSSE